MLTEVGDSVLEVHGEEHESDAGLAEEKEEKRAHHVHRCGDTHNPSDVREQC